MISVRLKKEIVSRLRKNILLLEGFKPPAAGKKNITGLAIIENAFPNGIFPAGAIHEFLNNEPEHLAASGGFIAGLLNSLMDRGGVCLWVSASRTLFPPALSSFGLEPHRVIFIDLERKKEILWATEEALKYEGLAAVVAELDEISFAESRRLQLAVEKSRVTGFIIRKNCRKINTTACTTRWRITHLPSKLEEGMPGVGHPRWNVELLKVRNGNPGSWQVEWDTNHFHVPGSPPADNVIDTRRREAV